MDLNKKANEIRKEVIRIAIQNGAGHIAPSLSSVDILTALYYKVLKRTDDPRYAGRDRFIFSKAHGCYGLYAILADIGYLPRSTWESFYKEGPLSGCQERCEDFGIEAGCGSLGHGLPMAVGLAFGARLQGLPWKVYCVTGDGEMQEGSVWEALQFAAWHKLSNLTVIIDHNRLQAMDFCIDVLSLPGQKNDLGAKCEAFGARVARVNGHDTMAFAKTLIDLAAAPNDARPLVVVAETTKGYGLSCMENVPKFHFRIPSPDELKQGWCYEC
jgi:Transketolase, N-terminal subunit